MRLAITMLVLGMAAPAHADESYAEQVITGDAVALGVTLGGEASGHTSLRNVGLGLTISAAPLVHLANDNRWGAAQSLALRVTLPLATTLAVDYFTENRTTNLLATAFSMAVASAIDARHIAKKHEHGLEWRPSASFKSGGVQLNVGTRF